MALAVSTGTRCERRFSRAHRGNGQIGGAQYRLMHALIARQFGVGQQTAQQAGLRPQIARRGEAHVRTEDPQVAILVLRGQNVTDIFVRLAHGLFVAGKIGHHQEAGAPVPLRLTVPPVDFGGVAIVLR